MIGLKMENYKILGRIGEGAHGVVLKARHTQVRYDTCQFFLLVDVQTGELVALKRVHLKKLEDGIPNAEVMCTQLIVT